MIERALSEKSVISFPAIIPRSLPPSYVASIYEYANGRPSLS
jgi:hypothetical protein